MGSFWEDFLVPFAWSGFLNSTVVFCTCVVLLLGRLGRWPRYAAALLLQALALVVVEVLLYWVFFLATGSVFHPPVVGVVVHGGIMAGYAWLASRLSWQSRIIRTSTFVAVFQLLSGLVGSVGPAFDTLADVLGPRTNVAMDVVCVAYALFLLHYSTEPYRFLPSSYVVLITVIDVLGVYCDLTLSAMGEPTDLSDVLGVYSFEVNLVFLVIVTLSYRFFYAAVSEHNEHEEDLLLRKAEADTGDQLVVARDVYESLREARHEIKNHDAYMRSLLDAGDYEGLRRYFDSYELQHQGLVTYVQSGQRTVDAVVNAEIAKARSQGVEIKCVLAVPSHLGYEPSDLYSLLANLLDNAIEGTVASGAQPRIIRLSIMPKGGYYVIVATNPCDASLPDGTYVALPTTKHDQMLHGWGTRVIARIARSYGGAATFEVRQGQFAARVMLERRDQGQGGHGREDVHVAHATGAPADPREGERARG